jgi:hypothetical protein
MAVGKELLLKGLLDEDVNGQKFTETELAQVFDKWAKLGSNTIWNLIAMARRFCGQGGYIDNILKLKSTSTYDYIHDSIFPGQGSGVSLVRQMQPGGDL